MGIGSNALLLFGFTGTEIVSSLFICEKGSHQL